MDLIKDVEQWLVEDGNSPKTIESYCQDVKQFQLYLAEDGREEEPLSRFSFVRYKQHLLEEAFKVSTNTLVHRSSCI